LMGERRKFFLMAFSRMAILLVLQAFIFAVGESYVQSPCKVSTRRVTKMMARGMQLTDDRESKRQARMSQLLRSELSTIIRRGTIKTANPLPDSLRERVSIVNVATSPDLRSAKIFVSIFGDAVEKRRAYAWLVDHSKATRHSLAQSLSSMKFVPDIQFKQTDLQAAVDVMSTLDRLANERKAAVEGSETGSMGFIGGLDFDFDEDGENE